MNKIKVAWDWLVISSADPSRLALTVKGLGSWAVIQVLVNQLLPAVGVHVPLDLNNFFDALSSVVYYGASAVTLGAGIIGAFRKLGNTLVGK